MKCLMLEFEEVKTDEYRAAHPFWRDGGDATAIEVVRDTSGKTWGVYSEGGCCEDGLASAEQAMWAAAAHVVREVIGIAGNEQGHYDQAEFVAAEHLLAQWQAAFDALTQKAGA